MCNDKYCDSIYDNENGLELITNGGKMFTQKKCNVPKFGKMWYNEQLVTNIFGFADLVKRYEIKYDSTKEEIFLIFVGEKVVRFKHIWNGLYAILLGASNFDEKMHLMMQFLTTVKDNKSFYSNCQINNAKQARDLFHALGCPSV